MTFIHKNLVKGNWQKISLAEQLANIGSEINRALRWQGKDEKLFENAVWRALELFDLTLGDYRWQKRLKEIARARELFCHAVYGSKEYNTTLEDLDRYFYYFAYLVRQNLSRY
jgi:hypothetical protein